MRYQSSSSVSGGGGVNQHINVIILIQVLAYIIPALHYIRIANISNSNDMEKNQFSEP